MNIRPTTLPTLAARRLCPSDSVAQWRSLYPILIWNQSFVRTATLPGLKQILVAVVAAAQINTIYWSRFSYTLSRESRWKRIAQPLSCLWEIPADSTKPWNCTYLVRALKRLSTKSLFEKHLVCAGLHNIKLQDCQVLTEHKYILFICNR